MASSGTSRGDERDHPHVVFYYAVIYGMYYIYFRVVHALYDKYCLDVVWYYMKEFQIEEANAHAHF